MENTNLLIFGYLFFSFILACVSANIALGKNRSGLGWFFIGFFLGILGVAIISVSSPLIKAYKPKSNSPEISSFGDTTACPFCAEIIKKQALICRYCNHQLGQNDNAVTYDNDTQKLLWQKLIAEAGDNCIKFAKRRNDGWDCVCGRINLDTNAFCLKCESHRDYVVNNFTKEAILKKVVAEQENGEREGLLT